MSKSHRPTAAAPPTATVATPPAGADATQSNMQAQEMLASYELANLHPEQGKMQHESRSFQTVSNVMKNRTDTAKNSIRNIN